MIIMTDEEKLVKGILNIVQQKGWSEFPDVVDYETIGKLNLIACDTCGAKMVSKETLCMLFTMARYVVYESTVNDKDFSEVYLDS